MPGTRRGATCQFSVSPPTVTTLDLALLESLWLTLLALPLTPVATSNPRPWLVPPQQRPLPTSVFALPTPGVALVRCEPGASV